MEVFADCMVTRESHPNNIRVTCELYAEMLNNIQKFIYECAYEIRGPITKMDKLLSQH